MKDSEKPTKALNDRSGYIKPVFRLGDKATSIHPVVCFKTWHTQQNGAAATMACGNEDAQAMPERFPEVGRVETKKPFLTLRWICFKGERSLRVP